MGPIDWKALQKRLEATTARYAKKAAALRVSRTRLLCLATFLVASCQTPAYAQVATVAGQSDCDGFPQSVCRFAATGIAYDPTTQGWYVGEKTQLVLRYIDSIGIVHTLPSKLNGLLGIGDVAVDSSGVAYLTDNFGCTVWSLQAGGWTRIAGTGTCGYTGDGGPAAAAQLNTPTGIAVSSNGATIYVSDTGNQRIRKLVRSGPDYTITTIAGGGAILGDGGPATSAKLANPRGLALDSLGRLWVADSSNHRLRRIGTDGTIITIAGNGVAGSGGDGGLPTAGNLSGPADVALVSDSVAYVTDTGGHKIRKVVDGVSITTAAGSFQGLYDSSLPTSAMFRGPQAVAVGPDGSLLVGDTDNMRLRRVALTVQNTPISATATPIPATPTRTAIPATPSLPPATATATLKPTVCTQPQPTMCGVP